MNRATHLYECTIITGLTKETRTLRYSKDFDDFLDVTNECIQLHKFKVVYEERPVQVQSESVKAQETEHQTEERLELSSAPRDKPSCSGLRQATLFS